MTGEPIVDIIRHGGRPAVAEDGRPAATKESECPSGPRRPERRPERPRQPRAQCGRPLPQPRPGDARRARLPLLQGRRHRADHPDVAADPRRSSAVGGRAHQPRSGAGGPRRNRLDDTARVGPRRPRHHLRRGRDDDRLPDDDRRGRRLHPRGLGQRHRLRRGRGAGGQARGVRSEIPHVKQVIVLPGRAATTAGSSRPTTSPTGGASCSPPPPTRRLAHRPARSRDPRRRHLHVRHDGPPQGRAPRAGQRRLRGRRHRGDRHVHQGRPPVPLAAALARLRQDAGRHGPADRLPDGRRRPHRQDRREHGGHQADLHGRSAAHLREGARPDRAHVRRGDGHQEEAHRLGAQGRWRDARRARARRGAVVRPAPQARPRDEARAAQGAGALRRPGPLHDQRVRPAQRGRRQAGSARSACSSWRATA